MSDEGIFPLFEFGNPKQETLYESDSYDAMVG